MKVRGSRKVEIQEKIIHDIFCNVCGKKIHKNKDGYFDDFLSIEKRWGYHSEFDNETHFIDICQACYKVLINNLKIKPDYGIVE